MKGRRALRAHCDDAKDLSAMTLADDRVLEDDLRAAMVSLCTPSKLLPAAREQGRPPGETGGDLPVACGPRRRP
jgi:hypothetical protein